MQELVRKNIRALQPYSCARDEFRGREAHVFVDANESPFNTGYNRYPDPLQEEIKSLLAPIKNVHPDEIFLGNGSDEAIDLVYRVFCEPRVDNVVAMAPSYGMYEVCANINDVEYRKVLLDENFQLHADAMLSAADDHTKVMWICSPNNPTGNDMDRKEVKRLLDEFPGILVVDETWNNGTLRDRKVRLAIPEERYLSIYDINYMLPHGKNQTIVYLPDGTTLVDNEEPERLYAHVGDGRFTLANKEARIMVATDLIVGTTRDSEGREILSLDPAPDFIVYPDKDCLQMLHSLQLQKQTQEAGGEFDFE